MISGVKIIDGMEGMINLAKSLLLQSDMTARLDGLSRIHRDTNKQEFTWDHLGITVIYEFRYQVGLGVVVTGTKLTEQNRMERNGSNKSRNMPMFNLSEGQTEENRMVGNGTNKSRNMPMFNLSAGQTEQDRTDRNKQFLKLGTRTALISG